MLCGMSSWLVQVTSVPLAMVSLSGPNLKLSILSWAASPDHATAGASRQASRSPRLNSVCINGVPSTEQGGIDDGERRFRRYQTDPSGAQELLQIASRHHHRTRTLGDARHALRERGGAGGMEGDMALDFLHDLMDVAVQHGDGAEALQVAQRLSTVLRTPAPILISDPKGHMREQHD